MILGQRVNEERTTSSGLTRNQTAVPEKVKIDDLEFATSEERKKICKMKLKQEQLLAIDAYFLYRKIYALKVCHVKIMQKRNKTGFNVF